MIAALVLEAVEPRKIDTCIVAPIGWAVDTAPTKNSRLVEVFVFLLPVKKEKKRWPEKVQRSRAWFDIETASARVREPTLKSLIGSLEIGLADVLTTINLTHAAMTGLVVKRAAFATRRNS